MTTRRNMIKAGAGLAAILASGKAPAALVRSMLAARNSIGMKSGGAKLPYDAEVEWMSSDGQSYVITNYIPPETQRFKISYSASTYSKQCYFGCGSGDSTGLPTDTSWCVLGASGNSDRRFNVRIRPDKTDWVYWCDNNVGNEYFDGTTTIVFDAPLVNARTLPTITLNGSSTKFVLQGFGGNNGDATLPIAIFGRNSPSGVVLPAQSDFKFRELMFFGTNDETNLLAHFIPVRVGNDGAMYDRVSGQLFRNQGTGAFVVGPDKTAWVNPYVTDGLVAMWDGEWNAGGGVHDANATVWKDLVGTQDMELSQYGSFSDDSLVCAGTGYAASRGARFDDFIYAEAVVEYDSLERQNGNIVIWGEYEGNNNYAFSMDMIIYNDTLVQTGGQSVFYTKSNDRLFLLQYTRPNSDNVFALANGISLERYTKQDNWATRYGIGFFGGRQSGYSYRGEIKRVAMYSRIPTAAEIAANYVVDKARFNLP